MEPPIDSAAIDRLVKLGGPKFALEMMGLFVSYGGKKVGEARQACDAGDLKVLTESVHPLKSSAGNVGASHVQALAGSVETLAHEGKLDAAAAQLKELEQAFAAAVVSLESERTRLAGSTSETKS